jgi:hypothetical protein
MMKRGTAMLPVPASRLLLLWPTQSHALPLLA